MIIDDITAIIDRFVMEASRPEYVLVATNGSRVYKLIHTVVFDSLDFSNKSRLYDRVSVISANL